MIAPTTRLQSIVAQIIGGNSGTRAAASDRQRSCPWRLGNSHDTAPIGSAEPYLATVNALDCRATFVNEAEVSSAQAYEIGELGLAAISPVFDVMAIDNRIRAARKSATIIAVCQRAANRGWNGSRLAPNIEGLAGLLAEHWHHARVAQKPPRRSRGRPEPGTRQAD